MSTPLGSWDDALLQADEDPSASMRKLVGAWLARPQPELDRLIKWLQGYRLPAVGTDEEPYVWLLRGLPLGGDRYPLESRFAERAALLVSQKPEVELPGDRPEELLYNLLMLCAGLSSPDELAEPLYAMLERRRLTGIWHGTDFRYALTVALARNQIDNRLQPVWEAMLSPERHDFLAGNEYDAYEAILQMPPSRDARGEPALDAIGAALATIARRLEHEGKRRRLFARLIKRALDTHPGRRTWDIDLLRQADRQQWAQWAVEAVPSLFVRLGRQHGDREEVIVWSYLLDCLPESHDQRILATLCGGTAIEVELPREDSQFLSLLEPTVRPYRLGNPLDSPGSAIGTVAVALCDLELRLEAQGARDTSDKIRAARRTLLVRSGILSEGRRESDLPAIGAALKVAAERWASEPDREPAFRSIFEAVAQLFPEERGALQQATEEDLPEWAAESLAA